MKQMVGKVTLDDTFYPGEDFYCDGAVEDELLEIVRTYPESDYNKVIQEKKDWAVLYHLSHIRWNIVEWMPITKEHTVLEVGAGCGAITGILAEKAKKVTCIDLSKKRSLINATRNQQRDNIEILLGNFQDVEESLTQKFDWITLIGVFEYGQGYIDSQTPYEDFLRRIKRHLAPGGRIVIAIENRLGMKYFAGCTEDHTGNYFEGIEGYPNPVMVRTFSRPEIERIAEEAGLPVREFYYPYPDYKLPMAIYSDSHLPKPGELNDNLRNFDRERYLLFDEEKAFDAVSRDGLFPVFSNSFLIVLQEEEKERGKKTIFSKYSNERARRFAIRTDVLEDGNQHRSVRKLACYPQGQAHMENLANWYEKLEAAYADTPISMNRCVQTKEGVEPEFVKGHTLEKELDEMLQKKEVQGCIRRLMDYIALLKKAGTARPFVVTEAFEEVFGPVILPGDLTSAAVTDIDMLVSNVIVTDGGFVHMDYEWTFDFPIPVNFVIYRTLMYYMEKGALRAPLMREDLYRHAGLTQQEIAQYVKMEAHFQQYILGESVPLRMLYRSISAGYVDFAAEEKRRKRAIQERNARLTEKQQKAAKIQVCVDTLEEAAGMVYIKGWAVNRSLRPLAFSVKDHLGREWQAEESRLFYRQDVNLSFGIDDPDYCAGFSLACRAPGAAKEKIRSYLLQAADGEAAFSLTLHTDRLRIKNSRAGRKLLSLRGGEPRHEIRYITPYERGLIGETKKFHSGEQRYDTFREMTKLTKEEEKRQRSASDAGTKLISIVSAAKGAAPEELRQMLDSVCVQTYPAWELVIACDAQEDARNILEARAKEEKRIRIVTPKHKKQDDRENGKESGKESDNAGSVNVAKQGSEETETAQGIGFALGSAAGAYVLFLGARDLLEPDALYEIAKMCAAQPDADIFYTDEDQVDVSGKIYTEPRLKPDYNLYMLRATNYIGRGVAVKKDLSLAAGGIDTAYGAAWDYDLILRCCEKAKKVCHIKRILYHKRTTDAAKNTPAAVSAAWDQGKRALSGHYQRMGIEAQVEWAQEPYTYRTRFAVEGDPKVSVIIPNMDHTDDLEKCIRSIADKTEYGNYEIVVVENNSREKKTFFFYEKLKKEYPQVKVLTWEGEFNYSAINNFAVGQTDGEYLLFLNNDTEVISRGWMQEMLGICQQPGVGITGVKLYYPDHTIQHAGVIIGLGGIAGHLFVGEPGNENGYMARAGIMQNLSAVTAACMMTKRETFLQAGGFDETLKVALNDVDYCLKVRKAGQMVVFTPHAQLYHYESKSRGMEDTPGKRARYEQETAYFRGKWQDILEGGDPFYHPNLSLTSWACALCVPEA